MFVFWCSSALSPADPRSSGFKMRLSDMCRVDCTSLPCPALHIQFTLPSVVLLYSTRSGCLTVQTLTLVIWSYYSWYFPTGTLYDRWARAQLCARKIGATAEQSFAKLQNNKKALSHNNASIRTVAQPVNCFLSKLSGPRVLW